MRLVSATNARALSVLLLVGTVLAIAVPARAATFGVSPVDVTLARGERSHLIVVTNEDTVPLRFQLDGYRWDERPDGEMALAPSDALIFFPRLFEVQPGQTQNVRVSVMAPGEREEKTYRLVIHQLKPFAAQAQAAASSDRETSVSILTNAGGSEDQGQSGAAASFLYQYISPQLGADSQVEWMSPHY